MVRVTVSETEISDGYLTPRNRLAAIDAIRHDGFVILENVVKLGHLAILREKMLEDIQALVSRKDAPYNWNRGNIQQDPPPFAPYLFRDILMNDIVVDVTRALLGPGVKNYFYSGNTAMPSDARQPVHADTGQLWKDMPAAHPPAQLVVNVPLVGMGPENGSTELWPGTHLDTSVSIHDDIKVPADILEARRHMHPPIQPQVAAGSVLIRDIRLWHAGMPNQTQNPRPMIAMIHVPHWLSVGSLKFQKDDEAFFQHQHLTTVTSFVDGPIDYIHAPQAYEAEGAQ